MGIPFHVAAILDSAVIFIAGDLIETYDRFLGAWLMWGGVGVFVIMMMGWKQQARDAEDLHNARIYAERVQEHATGGTQGRTRPGQDDVEDVSTGPRSRR